MSFGRKAGVARPVEDLIGALKQDVRDRRVMAHLLQVKVAPVTKTRLNGFTKNRVQGFVPSVSGVDEGE